ncbi:hypothetical protein JOD29_003690 [Lysinibacillus composti]|uniref:HEAT repeat domain-containing protein n=1 Tax=Lysinibacillus composti TaxID=720633 RepID=A0A3N9U6R2_9BACI|nr:hypothetical protein [Lysinibacillus composti]MBM7610408.1 hypothetical protein [Lysinibacillus composti]RQW72318.1 hypothetical protein EBB45_18370 [Lysinibacillus composti]
MTVLNKLASQLQSREEQPNIELAHELVNSHNLEGIREVIENLANKDKKIQQDCIKVAYEIGELNPEFICEHAQIFIDLLKSRNNRMVWGAMQALAIIAPLTPDILMENLKTILSAIKVGSVITVDKGILTLAKLAAVNKENNEIIFPYLLEHLKSCRSKEVPQHAESTLIAVTNVNKEPFLIVLRKRESSLTEPQLKRVKRIYRQLGVN